MSVYMVIGPDGATEPSNSLSEIGGLIKEVLTLERVTKRWSINERVQPLSIKTLSGKGESNGAEIERTSWRADGEGEGKREKALQNGGPGSETLLQHETIPLADMLLILFLNHQILHLAHS